MPYQTGTVTNFTNLKTTIESFATTNGWALTSGVLNKGQSNIKLTIEPNSRVSNNDTLRITGANSVDFLTEEAPAPRCLYADPTSFSITYYLFVQASPDTLVCVITFDSIQQQVLMFGEITKIDPSAFVGGNFFWASLDSERPDQPGTLESLSGSLLRVSAGTNGLASAAGSIPFARLYYGSQGTPIHAKVDGNIWNGDLNTVNTAPYNVQFTEQTLSSWFRSPNITDSQAHLVPMHLEFAMEDSLWGYLGYIDHIRLIKINNYEIGDIVTIGPDKWKVFPWGKKDLVFPNGGGVGESNANFGQLITGALGLAVTYDGP